MSELADDERRSLLAALLEHDPPGQISAVGENGLLCPMPPSVPVGRHALLRDASTALDVVVPEDHTVVVDVWMRLRDKGSAQGSVRLAGSLGGPVTLYAVDARPEHGVYLMLLAGAEALLRGPDEVERLRPRYGVVHKDAAAALVHVDPSAQAMLDWDPERVCDRPPLELVHPQDRSRAIAHWVDLLAHPGSSRRLRLRQQRGDGQWVWVEVTNHNHLDDPQRGYVLAELVDISDEMAAAEALRAKEELLSRLTEALPVGVLQLDHRGVVVYRNDRAEEILGSRVEVGAAVPVEDGGRLAQALRDGGPTEVTLAGRTSGSGTADLRRVQVNVRELHEGEPGSVVCLHDVTDAVRLREELHHRATVDELTGCLNRRALMDRLTALLQEGRTVTALFVDLDGFKQVNDVHGHAAGDALLRHVGRRLSEGAAPGDVVGRLGGDEFFVATLAPQTDEAAFELAERVAQIIGVPLRLDSGPVLRARASVGVARSAAGTDAEALVASADAVMYDVKTERRETARAFS